MSQQTIHNMIGQATTSTSPTSSTNTPNTQKRTRNYVVLNKYGLDGSPEP
jgi:hypothetical protein